MLRVVTNDWHFGGGKRTVSIGQWKSKRAEQQVIQLFSNSLYKTHHSLRGFFGYYLSDFVTIWEKEHRTASD